jgi:hypothetical protein
MYKTCFSLSILDGVNGVNFALSTLWLSSFVFNLLFTLMIVFTDEPFYVFWPFLLTIYQARDAKVFSLLVASLAVLTAFSSNPIFIAVFGDEPEKTKKESAFRGPGTVVPSEGLAPFLALLIGGVSTSFSAFA